MLAMSDIDINQFFPVFADLGVSVAFIVPTPTGYGKSIMDAIGTVRTLLREEGVHDYLYQSQGTDFKARVVSYFVKSDSLIETRASLYRPITKKGDPRIWFDGLKKYCDPCNLLALVVFQREIYVLNLSDRSVRESLFNGGYVYRLLQEFGNKDNSIANELLWKIKQIHDRGFLPSITPGDPGVGDTLEYALGIARNNFRLPDYKGIELKASRITRNGMRRQKTRQTLFAKVPDEGMSYKDILDAYGKWQIPRNSMEERFQLIETCRASRENAYGLFLETDMFNDKLNIMSFDGRMKKYVSSWNMSTLKQALLIKHHETFWVKAVSETKNGKEYFRYDKVEYTKNPNASLLMPLIDNDNITLDLAAYYKTNGVCRDHGMLFKMWPEELHLLFGEPKEYILEEL